jgi:hypothetical protein
MFRRNAQPKVFTSYFPYPFTVDASTRTPTPIVDDTEILRRKTPFDDAGFDLFKASISAARLRPSPPIRNTDPPAKPCSGLMTMSPCVSRNWRAAPSDRVFAAGHQLRFHAVLNQFDF